MNALFVILIQLKPCCINNNVDFWLRRSTAKIVFAFGFFIIFSCKENKEEMMIDPCNDRVELVDQVPIAGSKDWAPYHVNQKIYLISQFGDSLVLLVEKANEKVIFSRIQEKIPCMQDQSKEQILVYNSMMYETVIRPIKPHTIKTINITIRNSLDPNHWPLGYSYDYVTFTSAVDYGFSDLLNLQLFIFAINRGYSSDQFKQYYIPQIYIDGKIFGDVYKTVSYDEYGTFYYDREGILAYKPAKGDYYIRK